MDVELIVLLYSGQNNHLLLSMVKHLDHRNVAKQIDLQVNIIKIVTQIAQHAQLQASVSIVTVIGDLMRHLRKCLQCSIEAFNIGRETSKWNSIFHSSLEVCLMELTKKVDQSCTTCFIYGYSHKFFEDFVESGMFKGMDQ